VNREALGLQITHERGMTDMGVSYPNACDKRLMFPRRLPMHVKGGYRLGESPAGGGARGRRPLNVCPSPQGWPSRSASRPANATLGAATNASVRTGDKRRRARRLYTSATRSKGRR